MRCGSTRRTEKRRRRARIDDRNGGLEADQHEYAPGQFTRVFNNLVEGVNVNLHLPGSTSTWNATEERPTQRVGGMLEKISSSTSAVNC